MYLISYLPTEWEIEFMIMFQTSFECCALMKGLSCDFELESDDNMIQDLLCGMVRLHLGSGTIAYNDPCIHSTLIILP